VLYTSGYAGQLPETVRDDPRQFLAKPYTPSSLVSHVRMALESAEPAVR
jgi:hypothetical protein